MRWTGRSIGGLVVLLVALLVVGAGVTAFTVHRGESEPVPTVASEVEWPSAIAPIAHEVEHIRGLHFRHAVPVRYLHLRTAPPTAAALDDRERAALQSALQPYVALGLVSEQVDVARLVGAVSDNPSGAYSPRSGVIRIYLPAGRMFTKIVLAHELTHALEDQNFPERRRPSPRTDSETVAQRSIIEGSATVAEQHYIAQWTLPFERVDRSRTIDLGRDPGARSLEWFVTVGEAPYVLGPTYIDTTLALGDVGWDDIISSAAPSDAVIVDPLAVPTSVWQATSPTPSPSVQEPTALEVYLILASRIGAADALDAVGHISGATLSTSEHDGRRCSDVTFVTANPRDPVVLGALDQWVAAAGPANASRSAVPNGVPQVVASPRRASAPTMLLVKPGAPVLTSCPGISVAPYGSFIVPLTELAGRNASAARALGNGADSASAACIADAVLADSQYRAALQRGLLSHPTAADAALAHAYHRASATCGAVA